MMGKILFRNFMNGEATRDRPKGLALDNTLIIKLIKTNYMTKNTNYSNHRNIGIYGLRSFLNPQDAWNVVCSKWGNEEDNIQILNDETFKKVIVERVIEVVIKGKLEEISQEKYNKMLGLGDTETNYLTDFNFFLYSNKTRKFYTSIVHYNGYHWPGLGKSEWEVNEEIGQVYCFPELIQTGMDFVQTNSYMFNQYKKSEVMEKMIEKWQYS